jgi:hypothetical protein
VGDDYTNKTYVDTAITGLASTYAKLAGPQTFTGTHTFNSYEPIKLSGLTAFRVLQVGLFNNVETSAVTTTELGYVSGVTSAIQTQIDSKASTSYVNTQDALRVLKTGDTMTGILTNSIANPYADRATNPLPSYNIVASSNSQRLYMGSYYTTGQGACATIQSSDYYSSADHGTSLLINPLGGAVGIGTEDVLGIFNIFHDGGQDFITLQNGIYSSSGSYINLRFMFGKGNTSQASAYIQAYLNSNLETALLFFTDDGSGAGVAERMRITGDGRVGIGTTDPDTELYVVGKGKFHNGTVGVPAIGVNGGDGTRLVLWPGNAGACPYALGIDGGTLWYGTPASATHKWYNGTTNVMTLNSGGNLILNNRLLNVVGGQGYAVPNGYMAAGSLTIGSITQNYGGGSNWTSNTAGLMFECQDSTEIAIHDSGARVVSFMYYVGNQLSIGRNMGWGSPDIQIYAPTLYLNSRTYAYGTINTYSDATNNGSGSHIFVSNQGAGDSYAIMYLNSLGGACYWFLNGNGRSADGGPLTATLRNDSGNLRLQSSGGNGFTIDAGSGYTRKYGGNSSKILFGPNSTWGAYLVVGAGTNEVNSNTAQVISTNGNLHLDAGTGRDLYINNYPWAAGSVGNIYSWAGDFWTHNGKLHIKQSADQTANFAVANPNGAITHFGYSNNWNYIRGPTIFDTNYVTIGANYSHPYPLWVSTSQNTFWYLAWYYGNGGQQFHNWFGTWPVSIWATHAIVTEYWFGTVSDRRIKTNIKPVGNMLDIINKIEVVSFDFIDPITHKRDECGVIAQQVEEVFPNLVDKSIGVIPNIMKCVSAFEKINETLKLYYKRQDSDELIPTSKVKLILGVYGQTIEESSSKGEYLVQVIDVGPDFIVVAWEHNVVLDGLSVFVYGKQVNDFRNVDKEQLGVMAIKGVQELHSIATSHATLAQEQQKQIDVLTQRNQVLEAHARKLESDFSEYRERTEARLEKIGAILQSLLK